MIKDKLPRTIKHLQDLNIPSDVYLIEWIFTGFVRQFHITIVSKIWDYWLS